MVDATYDNLTVNTQILLAGAPIKLREGTWENYDKIGYNITGTHDGPTYIYHSAGAGSTWLTFNGSDYTSRMLLNTAGQLQLPVQGSTGGLVIGGDAKLYRNASNTLKTNSDLIVGGSSGNQYLTIAGGTSDGTTSTLNLIDTNNYLRVVAGATSGSMQIAAYTSINFFTNHDYTNTKATIDTSGNLTVAGGITTGTTLTVNGNFTSEALITSHHPFYTPASYEAWLAYLDDDNEGTTPFPNTTRTFHFVDTVSGGYTDMIGGLWKQENGFPTTAPFVLTRHHLVVKKDFMAKGQLVSYEGCVTLYGGHAGWITGSPYNTNNPIILLGESSTSDKNCLEIRTGHDHAYGGLICGVVSGKGYTNFDSSWGIEYPSRTTGTVYANTSGKTKVVYISFDLIPAGIENYGQVQAFVNGGCVLRAYNKTTKQVVTMTFLVPHGKEYSLTDPNGFVTNLQWSEAYL